MSYASKFIASQLEAGASIADAAEALERKALDNRVLFHDLMSPSLAAACFELAARMGAASQSGPKDPAAPASVTSVHSGAIATGLELATVATFAAMGPFTENQLRWWIFNSSNNGLDSFRAIKRVGRRVYIDTGAFNRWIASGGVA